MSNHERWEKIYDEFYASDADVSFAPLPAVRKALRFAKKGRVLDIGAGYGMHALLALEKNFTVDAIDFSPRSLRLIKQRIPLALRPRLRLIHGDISATALEGAYDLIICTYVTQYFNKQERMRLVNKLKRHTASRGIVVFQQALHQDGKPRLRWKDAITHFMGEGELLRHYSDWEVCLHQTMAKRATAGRLDVRRKEVAIFRKPPSDISNNRFLTKKNLQ